MRILYVGNAQGLTAANRFYLIPQKLINGFVRNGHNVYVFNDRDVARSNPLGSRKFGIGRMNRRLLECVAGFQPEFVLLGHCEMVRNETLREIRRLCPGTKIVYRNVDPLIYKDNWQRIRRRLGEVDGVLLTTAGPVLDELADEGTWTAFMPNPIDPSIETGRAFATASPQNDLFFAGGPLGADDPRRKMLETLSRELPQARLAFHGGGINRDYLLGVPYLDALSTSRIGLCLNRTYDYRFYSSDRMAQYLGQGLLTALQRGTGFEELFEEEEMLFYDGLDELLTKVRGYLANDVDWRRHAEAGWRKAHRLFNCSLVAQYLVELVFEQSFSQTYVWDTDRHFQSYSRVGG